MPCGGGYCDPVPSGGELGPGMTDEDVLGALGDVLGTAELDEW